MKLGEEFCPILPVTSTHARAPIYPDCRSLTRAACWRANFPDLFDSIGLMKKHPVVTALICLRAKVPYFLNVTLKTVKSTQFKRVLSDVAAMLSSSGYKTL